MGDVGADGFLVIPVEDNAGAGLVDYAGHGAVGLADSQNRDHRGQVFEQFAGQGGPVFRLLAERENQKGGIRMDKSPKTGAYVFVEQFVDAGKEKDFFEKK